MNEICIIDGHHGVYIPQFFAENFPLDEWGVSAEDKRVLLAGPNHPDYWEVWDDVLTYASFTDEDGHTWHLEQDGDLFAVRDDYEETDEETN